MGVGPWEQEPTRSCCRADTGPGPQHTGKGVKTAPTARLARVLARRLLEFLGLGP